MARRKIGDQNIRKISKAGKGSLYVTIPIEIARTLGWREKQKVVVKKRGESIVISDWKK